MLLCFLLILTSSQAALARFRGPKIDCDSHKSSLSAVTDGIEEIYNAHFYRSPDGKDTQEIIDRTGKYSALGHAEVTKSNGKTYGSSATLFHNCLAVVSRHAFEFDPVVGTSTMPLFFGPPKGNKAFSHEVTGTVVEVPEAPFRDPKINDITNKVTDLVVVEIKDQDECAPLNMLTPAVPVPINADTFIKFNSGNSGDFEFLSTRTPHESDSKAIRNSEDIKKTRKSLRDTCGVSHLYTEKTMAVPRGTNLYHNCSSAPGSSGGAIAVRTTDPMLYVGAFHTGAPKIDGKDVATFSRFGTETDFEVDNQNANTAAFIGVLSPEILKLMAGE